MAKYKRLPGIIFTALAILITAPVMTFASNTNDIFIKTIRYEEKSSGIVIEMNRKTPCKAIHIDGNEILIAVKNGALNQQVPEIIKNKLFGDNISIDKLPGDITALIINTHNSFSNLKSNWLSDGKSLLITIK
jgi:hypothetical protein